MGNVVKFEISHQTKLVIFDVAGTTVLDDGLVIEAFLDALEHVEKDSPNIDQYLAIVKETMGERKIDVFMKIFGVDAKAQVAHEAFMEAYLKRVKRGEVVAIPGSERLFKTLRENGMKVALNTGFSRNILDAIIDSLEWRSLIDFSIASSEVNQGRPAADMINALVEKYRRETGSQPELGHVVVLGDTVADMIAAKNAGISNRIAILSGVHTEADLISAGANFVASDINEIGVEA
jgi:phosphonatase-like hydrolase